jgi:two-component system KDP operon response regulator KdpE
MLTHRQILKDVWGPAHAEDMQYLRVYVGQLREKIEKETASPKYIVTEPGIGYRMEILPGEGAREKLPEAASGA